jgi:hypothetical protein
MSKPRGRTGPNAAKAIGSETSVDTNALLLQTLNSAFTMLSKTIPAAVHTVTHSAADSYRASSPPPPIEDELEKCLEAFRKAKGLSSEVISVVLDNFRNISYSPDAICEASPQRLEEVSGLKEGQVLTMKKFVREWCGKIDAKKARRGIA